MKNKKGSVLICMGLLLVAAALFLTVFNCYDSRRASRSVEQVVSLLEAAVPDVNTPDKLMENTAAEEAGEIEIPDYILNPGMEMPVQNIEGQDYIGILSIPALGLELPVISEWSYPRLKIAPCRYGGSAYTGDLIIAAHNFQSHFGGLKDLDEGETVCFTDVDGNVFSYEVVVRETLAPTDVEGMVSGGWDLTLFTCTYGGSARVTVRCSLVEN